MLGIGGAAAFAGQGGIGAGVDVQVISKTTQARILGGADVDAEGDVVVEVNGDCSPCQEMSDTIGPGVRDHLRDRAGITGSIVKGGTIRVGDTVEIN